MSEVDYRTSSSRTSASSEHHRPPLISEFVMRKSVTIFWLKWGSNSMVPVEYSTTYNHRKCPPSPTLYARPFLPMSYSSPCVYVRHDAC